MANQMIHNQAQGYFPRHSDFVLGVKLESESYGRTVSSVMSDYKEYGMHEMLTSPYYRSYTSAVIKSRFNWSKFYPAAMERTPLVYAFMKNPELTMQLMDNWNQNSRYELTKNPFENTIHQLAYQYSIDEGSRQYAAHLDVAIQYGAKQGGDLSAVVPPERFNGTTVIPLAAYVSHLRLNSYQLQGLSDVYYRWMGAALPEGLAGTKRYQQAEMFNWITSSAEQFTTHVLNRWAGNVPEGTELAWELASIQHQDGLGDAEWLKIIADNASTPESVVEFDVVSSQVENKRMGLEMWRNGIDHSLFGALEEGIYV